MNIDFSHYSNDNCKIFCKMLKKKDTKISRFIPEEFPWIWLLKFDVFDILVSPTTSSSPAPTVQGTTSRHNTAAKFNVSVGLKNPVSSISTFNQKSFKRYLLLTVSFQGHSQAFLSSLFKYNCLSLTEA